METDTLGSSGDLGLLDGRIDGKSDTQTENFDFEGVLPPSMALVDAELAQILHEVNQISRALRSASPDSETLRVAAHAAVWSALAQSLLNLRASLHLAQRNEQCDKD